MCILCDVKRAGASAEVQAMVEGLMMNTTNAMKIHSDLYKQNPTIYTPAQKDMLDAIDLDLRGNQGKVIDGLREELASIGVRLEVVELGSMAELKDYLKGAPDDATKH